MRLMDMLSLLPHWHGYDKVVAVDPLPVLRGPRRFSLVWRSQPGVPGRAVPLVQVLRLRCMRKHWMLRSKRRVAVDIGVWLSTPAMQMTTTGRSGLDRPSLAHKWKRANIIAFEERRN